MDKSERQRLKTLANEAIIATFGNDSREQRLAEGLENCLDELDYIAGECDHCKTCETHGNYDDDSIPVDASEVMSVHGELKKLLQRLKDYHIHLCGEVAEGWADPDRLTEPLAEIIEETESQVDELEACVIT